MALAAAAERLWVLSQERNRLRKRPEKPDGVSECAGRGHTNHPEISAGSALWPDVRIPDPRGSVEGPRSEKDGPADAKRPGPLLSHPPLPEEPGMRQDNWVYFKLKIVGCSSTTKKKTQQSPPILGCQRLCPK